MKFLFFLFFVISVQAIHKGTYLIDQLTFHPSERPISMEILTNNNTIQYGNKDYYYRITYYSLKESLNHYHPLNSMISYSRNETVEMKNQYINITTRMYSVEYDAKVMNFTIPYQRDILHIGLEIKNWNFSNPQNNLVFQIGIDSHISNKIYAENKIYELDIVYEPVCQKDGNPTPISVVKSDETVNLVFPAFHTKLEYSPKVSKNPTFFVYYYPSLPKENTFWFTLVMGFLVYKLFGICCQ